MKNKKEICKREFCTGCSACMNVCPANCIEMLPDGVLGHLYPHVNISKCVNCNRCAHVCPSLNKGPVNKPISAYAAISKNIDEYKTSTSGGIASILSKNIIERGGVVYGCASLEGINVEHVRIDSLEGLKIFKGSKYVQSKIGYAYKNVLSDLKDNRIVLFIGTPCQVAGLKSYLKKSFENLYTVDLICHGVPSNSYLKQHVAKINGETNGIRVVFREGNDTVLSLFSHNKLIYSSNLWKQRYEDTYINTFIDGYTFRPSCHVCKYANPHRMSDITIGDFWGLKTELPIKHPYGCSLVLPNTSRGESLLVEIKDKCYLYQRPINEAIEGNDQLNHPVFYTKKMLFFMRIASFVGISTAYRICEMKNIVRQKISSIRQFIKYRVIKPIVC